MSQTDEALEWRSVLDALRGIPVETAQSVLGSTSVVAYTDGACITNPGGPAGWSALLWSAADVTNVGATLVVARQGAPCIECYGHIPKSPTTTNNRAEITAVLAALSIAPREQPLTIYSDSEYTVNVAQGIYQMKANTDLWALYRTLLNRRQSPPIFVWVRGHAGHIHNERADELAGLAAWNGDRAAYEKWQASQAFEAHNKLPPAELAALRQQVQQLKAFVDSPAPESTRVSAQEREFINDMAKRLRKNNFVPSPKQSNWLKRLVRKYQVHERTAPSPDDLDSR